MKAGIWSILACAAASLQTTALAGEEYTSRSCTASAAVSYSQHGAEADVEMTLENRHCAASSGDFIVVLTVKAGDAAEAEKLRFEESWARSDDQPVFIAKRYPIGDNVDLLRIRIRKLTCDCTSE
jgi:hypothetical protein